MSIFPTKIILSTDSSEHAELALSTAADLANITSSELHVVHVVGLYYPDLQSVSDPAFEEMLQRLEQEAQELLDDQVRKIPRPVREA